MQDPFSPFPPLFSGGACHPHSFAAELRRTADGGRGAEGGGGGRKTAFGSSIKCYLSSPKAQQLPRFPGRPRGGGPLQSVVWRRRPLPVAAAWGFRTPMPPPSNRFQSEDRATISSSKARDAQHGISGASCPLRGKGRFEIRSFQVQTKDGKGGEARKGSRAGVENNCAFFRECGRQREKPFSSLLLRSGFLG